MEDQPPHIQRSGELLTKQMQPYTLGLGVKIATINRKNEGVMKCQKGPSE